MPNFLLHLSLGVLIQASVRVNAAPGVCAMYGTCDPSTDPHALVNCVNYTAAVQPDFAMPVCPEFADLACCNSQQYRNVVNNLKTAQVILGRCPACYDNFRKFWCYEACSPDQSMFLDVADTTISPSTGLPVVNHTVYSIASDYAWGFFDSCFNVKFGSTNSTVFQLLFGNPQTPQALFEFMGNAGPAPHSPIQIDFVIPDPSFIYSMEAPFYPCNTTSSSMHCACTDCPASCSADEFQ